MPRAGASPGTEGSSRPAAALLMEKTEPNGQHVACPSRHDGVGITATAQRQALAHLREDTEKQRGKLEIFFCSSWVHLLSLLPPFRSPCSRLEIEFDASFDRLVLCAETCELCCNMKPFSITVSGKTGCLMLLFLFSIQKPL